MPNDDSQSEKEKASIRNGSQKPPPRAEKATRSSAGQESIRRRNSKVSEKPSMSQKSERKQESQSQKSQSRQSSKEPSKSKAKKNREQGSQQSQKSLSQSVGQGSTKNGKGTSKSRRPSKSQSDQFAIEQKKNSTLKRESGVGLRSRKASSLVTVTDHRGSKAVTRPSRRYYGGSEETESRRTRVFRHLHKLITQKKLTPSLEDIMKDWDPKFKQQILRPTPHYKKPVEKLLKRVKQETLDQLPPGVNIHKHRDKRGAFIGGRGVRKEVELIQNVLQKHHKKVQPKVGWDYNKRQKRLLLGYRHRKLEHGWKYFEPIKNCLPRGIRPNNHVPDGMFFFCNVMMFISMGYYLGIIYAWQSLPLEDLYEFKYHYLVHNTQLSTLHISGHEGDDFWKSAAHMQPYIFANMLIVIAMLIILVLGFVGVYLADQKLHLVYVVGIALGLLVQILMFITFTKIDHCTGFMEAVKPILHDLVENYYNTTKVIDVTGKVIHWKNPETQETEAMMLRTYKAANIMDSIQTSLQCCGVKGPIDYTNQQKRVPASCCTTLWNPSMYCSRALPFDLIEFKAKFVPNVEGKGSGCEKVFKNICKSVESLMGDRAIWLTNFHLLLFLVNCVALIIQNRQIRQLKRAPHLRISAGSISQSLQTSATDAKGGGGGIQAFVEASKLTDKQADQLYNMRYNAGLQTQDHEDMSSSSSSSTEDVPVHSIDLEELKQLQMLAEAANQRQAKEREELDKIVHGFSRRFSILQNRNLQNYVKGIFTTTTQAETNAGLAAINDVLKTQLEEQTDRYNWRELLRNAQKDNKLKQQKKFPRTK